LGPKQKTERASHVRASRDRDERKDGSRRNSWQERSSRSVSERRSSATEHEIFYERMVRCDGAWEPRPDVSMPERNLIDPDPKVMGGKKLALNVTRTKITLGTGLDSAWSGW
jgi:hypothetical protein